MIASNSGKRAISTILMGWPKPGAALLITPGHPARGALAAEPYQEILFVPERNARREHVAGPMLSGDDPIAPKITGVDRVESLSALGEEILRLAWPVRLDSTSCIQMTARMSNRIRTRRHSAVVFLCGVAGESRSFWRKI